MNESLFEFHDEKEIKVLFLHVTIYCKSLKFYVGFILRVSCMSCFRKIKYHVNILAVQAQNPRNEIPVE